jgi:hypothetical protein
VKKTAQASVWNLVQFLREYQQELKLFPFENYSDLFMLLHENQQIDAENEYDFRKQTKSFQNFKYFTQVWSSQGFVGWALNPIHFVNWCRNARRKQYIESDISVHFDSSSNRIFLQTDANRLSRYLLNCTSESLYRLMETDLNKLHTQDFVYRGFIEYMVISALCAKHRVLNMQK